MLTEALTGKLTFNSLRPVDLSTCTKKELKDYFENTYSLNESIFAGLQDENALYKCPDRLRLPLIFYFGHTASVYINKLILAGLLKPEQRVDYEMETLCETGVDEMSWDDTENYRMGGKFQWPALSEVVEYRRKVKEVILDAIERTPLELPINMDSPWWGLMMCIEHERIHIETSSVLIRQLPINMVTPPTGWKTAPPKIGKGAGMNSLIPMSKSTVTIGKPKDFPSYGWDNEYGTLTSKVPAFSASKYPITNKEFYEFVLDGGYDNPSFWSEEGWNWVKYKEAKHPVFWVCGNGCKSGCGADLASYSHCKPQQHDTAPHCNGHAVVDGNGHQGKDEGGGRHSNGVGNRDYQLRCMYEEIEMPWDWPVEVNYLEAKAFCQWKGEDYRLLCEAEHHVIRGNLPSTDEGTNCDIIFQENPKANINLFYGSSTPVNMFEANDKGFYDVFGNTWEWIEDHYNGLPGFETHPYYDDFSSPTFDGKHNIMLGGSWISTGDEASRFARYAFRRHFFQHCGFRIARSEPGQKTQHSNGLTNDDVITNGGTSGRSGVKPLPVRVMDKGVYVLNFGIDEVTVMLEKSKYSFGTVETTNSQYLYETEEVLNEMLRLEYTSDCNLPQVIANSVEGVLQRHEVSRDRALHMGCTTGAVTFQIAKKFNQILAQDFCGRFINACQKLQNNESVVYTEIDGFKRMRKQVQVPTDVTHGDITFKQLTWLSNEVGFFDFVLSTALDRSLNPRAWLLRLPEVVKDDGLLVVISAHAWTENQLSTELYSFELAEAFDLDFKQFGVDKKARLSVWKKTRSSANIAEA